MAISFSRDTQAASRGASTERLIYFQKKMKKLYWLTTVLTPNPRLDVATHETYGGDGINEMLRRFFVCVAG